MPKTYLGHLPIDDPLHGYLRDVIQPQVDGSSGKAVYRVFRLNGSHDVYLYEDKHTGTRMVGKFFLPRNGHDSDRAERQLAREFRSLCIARDAGLTTWPHYIPRPLGCNHSINDLLVVEYCRGRLMSDVIRDSIRTRDGSLLFAKLTALAYLLATLHNRTALDDGVDFTVECAYLDRLIDRLMKIAAIGPGEAGELRWLGEQWRRQAEMWEDRQVLVHGDATPENFMLGDGLCVTAFDLERARRSDRVFDVGRFAGELKHFFLQGTGEGYAAEPFIGHFLWEYACHFPDRDRAFKSVTARVPFYMGTTLLRIARNSWVSSAYRRHLINEAKACLRSQE